MTENKAGSASHVFGRRKGRPLRVRKSWLMEEWYPRVRIDLPEMGRVDPAALFDLPATAPLVMEIGFGGGEHLAAQAKAHPGARFIGCEPFVNGVASLLDHLERDQIPNVRVWGDDARWMLDALPEASLDKVFVLFADPWPKKRHAERRFIGPENLARLARAIKPGGALRLASDHPCLIDWMREKVAETPSFSVMRDSDQPPDDWMPTRYQEKAALAGRMPVFLDCVRS